MSDTAEFIRSRAKLDWSRQMVADALGISVPKLKTMLEHLPDVTWCAPHRSCEVQRSHHARRGVCTPGLDRACALGRQARYALAPKFHIGSFIGTLHEVYDYWQEYICVSYHTVRRRIYNGMPALDAFFLPSQLRKGWGQNGKFWCPLSKGQQP